MTLKQVFIVNSDLKMSCGKTCAQIAHGETLYMEEVCYDKFQHERKNVLNDTELVKNYLKWKNYATKPIGMMKKIILKTDEVTLRNISSLLLLKGIKCYNVYDLGYTQVESGSFTCLCTEPLEEEVADKLFGHLKLL